MQEITGVATMLTDMKVFIMLENLSASPGGMADDGGSMPPTIRFTAGMTTITVTTSEMALVAIEVQA